MTGETHMTQILVDRTMLDKMQQATEGAEFVDENLVHWKTGYGVCWSGGLFLSIFDNIVE